MVRRIMAKSSSRHAVSLRALSPGERAHRPPLDGRDHLRAAEVAVPVRHAPRRDSGHHRPHAQRAAAGARAGRDRRAHGRARDTRPGRVLADEEGPCARRSHGRHRRVGREVDRSAGRARVQSRWRRAQAHVAELDVLRPGSLYRSTPSGPARAVPRPSPLPSGSSRPAFRRDVRGGSSPCAR